MRSFIAWHKERHREDIHLINGYFDDAAFEGLRDRIAHLFDWPHYSDDDQFYGPHGRLVANIVQIGFWTILFGGLYFRFVFRGSKRSNQTLQPTAGRSDA
jgi:hypothetical protein